MRDKLIEAMARAMYYTPPGAHILSWRQCSETNRSIWRDYARAALIALEGELSGDLRAPAGGGWRPIETGPYGEAHPYSDHPSAATFVLVCNEFLHVGVAWGEQNEDCEIQWMYEDGTFVPQPTHWQPLPPPPTDTPPPTDGEQVRGLREPIETAPRDGSKIDIWLANGQRVVDAYWSDVQETWCTDGAFGPAEPSPLTSCPAPTHWMRPPPPPEPSP